MLGQAMIEHVMIGNYIDEGACGRIYECVGYPHLIIKQQKRSSRNISHSPIFQQQLQSWAHTLMINEKFEHLTVPWSQWIGSSPKSSCYLMEKIDVSEPLDLIDFIPEELAKELVRFYFLCACAGYYPFDYEIYKQKDSKYSLVDFDKFGIMKAKGLIEFPFKKTITLQEAACWAPRGLCKIQSNIADISAITRDIVGINGLSNIPESPKFLDNELDDLDVILHLPPSLECEGDGFQNSPEKSPNQLKPPRANRQQCYGSYQ